LTQLILNKTLITNYAYLIININRSEFGEKKLNL